MAIYKVIIETKYYSERIVKANGDQDVRDALDNIMDSVNLADGEPYQDAEFRLAPDYDDDDVEIDLTTKGKTK